MGKRSSYPPGQFCWVDLMAADMKSAAAFYSDLLGWEVHEQPTPGPPYAMFTRDGELVAGIGERSEEMAAQGVPPSWNNYVSVENAEAAVARAREHGGSVHLEPMELPGAGHMAVIASPEGAPLFLWQPGAHIGATWVNHPTGFCWNELASRDLKGASEFFGAVLGWEFSENPASPSNYLMIQNGGRMNGGIIEMSEEWGKMPSHWTVYFSVEDVDATAARVKELGGTVHHGPFDAPPAGRIAVIADPQGAMFNAIQLQSIDD